MIYIENLDFGYQKKREVFSGLNLSLTGGHIYGLLGKNGAGKTTLLKLIGGLLFPLRGRIEVCDAIPRLRKPSFLSDIFFIPEEICLPDMKMKDYFPLICRFYPKNYCSMPWKFLKYPNRIKWDKCLMDSVRRL